MPLKDKSPDIKLFLHKLAFAFLVVLLVTLPTTTAHAAACTATASGNWSSSGIWSCGHVPTSSDDVMISNGLTITVDVPATVNSLTLNNGNASSSLSISGTNTLSVTNNVTLINTTNLTTKTLAVGSGSLNIGGNLNLNAGGGTQVTQLTIGTGTVTVNGNIIATGTTSARVIFSGAGMLNVAGAYPAGTTLTTAGVGTVNFIGTAQAVPAYTYYNLGLSGSGVKTLPNFPAAIGGNLILSGTVSAATAGNVTVTGNLNVGSGSTLTNSANNTLTVAGTSIVSGTLNFNGTGAKAFTGDVTINSGGVWNETGTAAFTFSGNLTNNGSYTASTGGHTFNGAGGKTIGGANALAIPTATFTQNYTNSGTLTANTLTVTGAAVRLTNNSTVNVNTSLAGTGGLTQGANAILKIGGTSAITTLTATAAGNSVNYTGAAAQTVKATTYAYLILSGNGVKSMLAATTVNTNLNIIHSGGATASIATGQTLAVNSLALDGTGQTTPPFPTTWGGTGSGAAHINSTYFAATTGRLNVAGADTRTVPTITFGPPPTPTYLGGLFTVNATTTNTDSSTLIYSVVSGPCVLVGGATFNSTGVGTCVVQAYGAPTTNFAVATATQSIAITRASQAPLTVSANPAVVVQGFTTTLSSAGGSGTGLVTYSVGSSTGCTLAVNIVTVTDASGTCSVTATKAADANYLAATSAPLTITLATYQSEINKDFSPINILPGNISRLSIKIYNPNAFALQSAGWIDNLIGVQPGLRLANPVNLSSDCGGTVSTIPGGTTISLSGGAVPAKVGSTNGICTVAVDVTSTTAGNLINTIPAGTLSATDGAGKLVTNTTPASATLQVTTIIAPTINKSFGTPTIWAGANSLLTVNLLNQNPTNALTGVSVADTLPENVVISSTVFSPALTNCGGGTLSAVPGTRTISLSGATIPAGVGQTCIIRVNTTSSVQGSYINTIPSGAIQTAQGVTNAQQAQATLNVQQLNLTKAFAPATIPAGGTSTATITLQNPTGVDYTNVGLVDNLPAGMTYVSTGAGTCGGSLSYDAGLNQVTFAGGTAPGSLTPPTVRTCTIIFTVTAPYTTGSTTLTNTIPAGSLTDDQNISNPTTVSANLTVTGALTATKAISPATITAGNPATVTITLQNSTGMLITGVSVTDNLPANLVLYSPLNPNQCSGTVAYDAGLNQITLTGGTIPPSSTPPAPPGTCQITFQVTSPVPSPPTYVNSIPVNNICGTLGALGPVCNTSVVNSNALNVNASALPVTGAKGFCVTGPCAAGATNSITVGGSSAMSIRLTAPVDTNLTNFEVTDTLPAGMTIFNTTATKNASCIGGTLNVVAGAGSFSWAGGTINAGTTCIITVNVTSSTSGTLTNTINPGDITNNEGRTVSAAFGASLVCSDYTISKSFTPTTVNANGLSRARITFTNQYFEGLTNVNLTDNLPANLFVAPIPNVSNNGCSGTVTANAGASVITLAGGSVPAKVGSTDGLCYIEVDVRATGAAGARTNTIPILNVTASHSGINNINPRQQAQATLTVAPLSITVNKSFFPLTVFGGSASTLTVTLSNPNNAQLTGITFTDTMPAGMYVANPPNLNPGSCGGSLTGIPDAGTFSYSGGSLAASASCNMTLSVSMNVNGNLTNIIPTGAVTSFNGASNPQPAQASLTNLGGVSLSKFFSPNSILIGDNSTLTITVQNTSNFTLHNLGLSDTLPLGLEIAASPSPANGCGGSLSAPVGTRTITLATGSIPKPVPPATFTTCNITVTVTGSAAGSYTNIIPPNTITNTEGESNTEEARDTLVINPVSPTITTTASPTTGTVGVNIPSAGDTATLSGGYNPTGSVTFTLYSDNTCTISVPGMSGSGVVNAGSASWSAGWTPATAGTYYWQASYPGDTNNIAYTTPCVSANEQISIAGLASLGNFVWNDLNADGIQNAGEPGFNGVTVNLYRPGFGPDGIPGNGDDADIVAITTTSGGGLYSFTNLIPGDYYVEVIKPVGYTFSPQDQGANDAIDSDANPATGVMATTTLVSGENDVTWDGGLYQLASLGDYVWDDLNANGIQEPGEPGIPNVTVHLLDAGGATLATTTTNASGLYSFTNLTPGTYRVGFVNPSGYTFSPQDQGSDDALDSDANPATGETIVTTLVSDENDLTWDAGLYQTTSLGDFVWNDLNADGIQNAGEPGISNVNVNLYTGIGTLLGTTTTNASGYYLFSNLTPGDYYIEFVPPSGYIFSPQDQGANDAIDSDADTLTGQTATTTLTSNESDLTWDAGLYIPEISVSKVISALAFTSPDVARMTYTITIINPNAAALTDIQATDDLQAAFGSAAGFTLIDLTTSNLTENPSYDGITDTNLLVGTDSLAAGDSGMITLVVEVDTGGTAATYTNTVDGSGLPPTGPRISGTDSAIGPAFADPAVAKTADVSQAMVGEQVTFTITVTNNGNQTAANVTVTDPLPGNLDVLSATASPVGTVNIVPPRTVVVDIGDVDPGDVININITARVNSLGTPPIQNVVTLATTSPTDILSNDQASVALQFFSPILPNTGFAPSRLTELPAQPDAQFYTAYDGLSLSIPSLKTTIPIVGVPMKGDSWDVTWLDKQAGWLNGTAFPTWAGNSIITGHVYLSNGLPGPFVNLGTLKYGDQVIINAYGKEYIYEVRSVISFNTGDASRILRHEELPWVTLLTCKDYDSKTDSYRNRIAIRAVLVSVTDN